MADEIKIEFKEIDPNMEKQPDFQDLSGFIKTTTTYPSWTPRKTSEQICLYVAGSVKQLCVYDTINNDWICFEHTTASPSASLSPSVSPSISPSVSPS